MIGLRWILEAPESVLTSKALEQKRELHVRYPAYKDLSTQAESIRQQLEQLPVDPEANSAEKLQQKELTEQLTQVVELQEKSLRQIALLREPCELNFPPVRNVSDVQGKLTPKQLIVSFLNVGPRYYVMIIGDNRYAFENVVQANSLNRKITSLLKKIGVSDKSARLRSRRIFK